MEHAIKEAPDVVPAIDFNAAKDNIVFQLVNTEQNKEMLQDIPNRSFQDLSIIYRWIVKTDVEGIQSTVIHNSLAEKLGTSEEQMFKLAVENTRRIFPPTVKSMNDVIRDMFMKDGMPAEIADMMIGEMPAEQTMWVISNDRGINGAISMLYEDKLHGLAENLGTDLYIMLGYLSHYRKLPMEEIADEMLAILSDRNRIMQKKNLENVNASWNEFLMNGFDDD